MKQLSNVYKGRYLDGVKPIPYEGDVTFEESYIAFNSISEADETMSVVLSHKDIIEITEESQNTLVLFQSGNDNTMNRVLTISGLEAGKQISRLRVKNAEKTSLKWYLWATQLSTLTKVGVGIPLALFSVSVFLILLFKLYLIIPLNFDRYIGKKVSSQVNELLQVCSNEKRAEPLQTIVERLTPENSPFTYKIQILQDDRVNAISIPGGYIYLFSGLLDQADGYEELTGVLAHEIAHIEKRHGVQSLIRNAGVHYVISVTLGAGFEELETIETLGEFAGLLAYFKYSKELENEADTVALKTLERHNISAKGLRSFFVKISDKNKKAANESFRFKIVDWLSSHPSAVERLNVIDSAIQRETFKNHHLFQNLTSWDSFEKQTCNLN